MLEGINLPPDDRTERIGRLFDYLLAQVHDHLDNPRDDLTTFLINAEVGGQKLDPSPRRRLGPLVRGSTASPAVRTGV